MMIMTMMSRKHSYLAILLLLGLLVTVATSSAASDNNKPSDKSKGAMMTTTTTTTTRQRGVKMMKKRKKLKKTKDLPRHRIKHTPHGWQRDHQGIQKETTEAAMEKEEEQEAEEEIITPVETREETQPQEKVRKLQKENKGGGRNFKRQGVDRGAGRQAARGGADTTSDNGAQRPREVPMMDWGWGTVWMDDGPVARGNAGTGEASEEQEEARSGGAAQGRGAGGSGGGGRGRGTGSRGEEGGESGSSASGDGDGVGNPFVGEEAWRKQFVSRLNPNTPRPTFSPQSSTTPRPNPSPTNPTQSEPEPEPTTPPPTPMPTPEPDPTEDRGSCQLCPNGGGATYMTRSLLGTNVKCQDIANTLATASLEDCPMQKEKLPVDIEAYCGCPGVSSRGSCTFCGSGLDNIWHNISIPALNDWTCENVEDYCGYITNAQACAEMQPISELCCGTWEEYWAWGDDDTVDDTLR